MTGGETGRFWAGPQRQTAACNASPSWSKNSWKPPNQSTAAEPRYYSQDRLQSASRAKCGVSAAGLLFVVLYRFFCSACQRLAPVRGWQPSGVSRKPRPTQSCQNS